MDEFRWLMSSTKNKTCLLLSIKSPHGTHTSHCTLRLWVMVLENYLWWPFTANNTNMDLPLNMAHILGMKAYDGWLSGWESVVFKFAETDMSKWLMVALVSIITNPNLWPNFYSLYSHYHNFVTLHSFWNEISWQYSIFLSLWSQPLPRLFSLSLLVTQK